MTFTNMRLRSADRTFSHCVLLSYVSYVTMLHAAYGAMPEYFFQDLCSDGHGGLSLGSQSAALLHCNSSRELNCTVSVSFPPKSGLLLTLAHLSMASSPNCSEDSLQVVGQTFCGNRSDQSETNQALQVLVEPGNPGSKVDVELLSLNNPTANFTLVLTTYTEVSSETQLCSGKRQHQCYNGHCIAAALFCDGHNHCGGQRRPSKEQCPDPVTRGASLWGLATIAFGVFSTVLLLPFFVWTAVRGGQTQVTSIVHPGGLQVPSQEQHSVNQGPGDNSVVCEMPHSITTSDTARLVTS